MTNRIAWSAAVRRALPALAGALALLAGCGSSKAAPQGDLAGSWDLVQISTNGDPGWKVASFTVASDGKIAMTSSLDSAGNTALPPPGLDARITVDANGNVALGGADGSPTFLGSLSSSKTLIVATDTQAGPPASYDLVVIRKRVPNLAYAPSDVAGLPFAFHSLQVGNSPGWQVGEGTTDASGRITVTSLLDSSGNTTTPPANFDAIQVDSNGLVTTAQDATFHGVMTPDKNAIFAVATPDVAPPQTHQLVVILRTGQTFTAADLGGSYRFHGLVSPASGAAGSWFRGALTIDSTGQMAFTSFLDSAGGTTPPASAAFQLRIDPSTGAISALTDATYRGRMAFGKDLYARTVGAAAPSLAISLK